MFRIIFILSFLLLFNGCNKDSGVEPYNYERDTPVWLKEKIEMMSNDTTLLPGTKIYRYEWRGAFVYHFYSFASSCIICEMYDQDGNRIQMDEVMVQDFLKNRSNEIVVWDFKSRFSPLAR